MADSDRLTEGERFVLTTPAGRRQRAEVVAGFDALADALDLPHDVAQVLVNHARAKADQGLDPSLAKQLKKAARNLTSGILEIGTGAAPRAIEAPSDAQVPTASEPAELRAVPLAQPEASTEKTTKKPKKDSQKPKAPIDAKDDAKVDVSIDDPIAQGKALLVGIKEGEYAGLTTEHGPSTVAVLMKLAQIEPRKNGAPHTEYFNEIFEGLNRAEIATKRGLAPSQVRAAVQYATTKIKGHPQAAELEVFADRIVSGEPIEDILKDIKVIEDGKKSEVKEPEEATHDKGQEKTPEKKDQTQDEWLAEHKTALLEALAKRGMTTEQAELIWQHLHFDEHGAHSEPSETKKQLLTSMRLRIMGGVGVPDLGHNPIGLAGVKKLVHTALSFNTMDTVYADLKAENPNLTEEEFERLVIGAVIELMN